MQSGGGLTYINFDYIFGKLLDFFRWIYHGLFGDSLWNFVSVLLAFFSIFFLFVIFYTILRIREMNKKEKENLLATIKKAPEPDPKNEKWMQVLSHIASTNPAEWRLAIIEADTILDQMTIDMRYPGSNLGERLKVVEPADWNTIQSAWEAHKVRNKIAHEGSNFTLSRDEAEYTIRLYEDVFNEFHYI